VWHFLVPDPGMAPFDQDKVVKALAPEAAAAIKLWRKEHHAPSRPSTSCACSTSPRASTPSSNATPPTATSCSQRTRQAVPVWGQPKPDGRIPNLLECDEHRRKLLDPKAPGQRLAAVMHYWCALWFWPVAEAAKLPSREAWLADVEALVAGREADPARLAVVRAVSERMCFFHWELAFPEVFARGGFDVMLGNPPWLKVEWDESAVLADFDPTIALRDLSAKEAGARREAVLRDDTARRVFFEELEASVGTSWFLGAAQNYPLLQGAQNNLYKCFLERAMSLAPAGAIGFIHQKGLYDDPGSGKLRSALLPRLVWRLHFLNKKRLFESIKDEKHFELTVCGTGGADAAFRDGHQPLPPAHDRRVPRPRRQRRGAGLEGRTRRLGAARPRGAGGALLPGADGVVEGALRGRGWRGRRRGCRSSMRTGCSRA
jgi:hypothetical protein